MPTLLPHTGCRACGRRHNFCLPTGYLTPGLEYEYVCPETAKRSRLRPGETGEVVRFYPQGAVQLADPSHTARRVA